MRKANPMKVENIKDAEDAFAVLRSMASDANAIAAKLVQFERDCTAHHYGNSNGPRNELAIDMGTAGRCRTLATALHELVNVVKFNAK
jgi:hypothetical protein